MFSARSFRDHRASAGGNGNMVRSNFFTVNFNGFVVDKLGKAFNKFNAVALETTVITAMNALYVGFAIMNHGCPVKTFLFKVKAIGRRILDSFCNMSAIPHDFLRYTTHVYAGTANKFCFNNGGLCTTNGGTVG